jgi:hypothetical protein
MDGTGSASTTRGGGVGMGESLGCLVAVAGPEDRSSPWGIHGGPWQLACARHRGNFNSRPAPRLRVGVRAGRNSAVRRRASVDALGSGTHDGPQDSWGGYGAVEDAARVPRVSARKWTGGSYHEAVGIGPTRMPRRRGALCAAQPSRQDARHAVSALERDLPVFQPVNPTLTACFSKHLNCATKTVYTKVVDETSLYNICKGCHMFFSTVWAGTPSKVRVLQSADEQWKLQLTKFFTRFRSKFEMPSNMKVVFLEKLDNFYFGRIWSV